MTIYTILLVLSEDISYARLPAGRETYNKIISDIAYMSEILHFVQNRPSSPERSEGRTYPVSCKRYFGVSRQSTEQRFADGILTVNHCENLF